MVLSTGLSLPLFTLLDQSNKKIDFTAWKNEWVVLYCYPKDDTPGCTVEAIGFSMLLPEFKKEGALVYGLSPDAPKKHCKFIEKHNLSIPLLCDESHTVLKALGVWGKKKFMGREYMGVLRTTFLINPKGKIAYVWKDVEVKGHAAEVLKKLKALTQ